MTAAHKPEMTSAAPGPAVVVTVATARDHDNIIVYLGDCGRRWGERHRGDRYHRHGCKGTRRKTDKQQKSHKTSPLIAYCDVQRNAMRTNKVPGSGAAPRLMRSGKSLNRDQKRRAYLRNNVGTARPCLLGCQIAAIAVGGRLPA